MSYAFPVSSRGVRTAAALGAAALGLLVTTGCGLTKPTPLTTVTVGSETVTTEAACFAAEDKALKGKEAVDCLKKGADATITVDQGERLHLGVEPEMGHAGWAYFVNQRPMSAKMVDSTYQTLDTSQWFQPQRGQSAAPDEVTLSVVTFGEGQGEAAGVWNVGIKRTQHG
jgi:hypothetical protein